MANESERRWAPALGVALAGPAALGAATGLAASWSATLWAAALLPAVVLGVVAVSLPAFYIGVALLGEDADLQRMATNAVEALRDAGAICLGLTPALALLVVTMQGAWALALSGAAVALAAALALRNLFVAMFVRTRPLVDVPGRTVLAYVAWSTVVLALGLHWFAGAGMFALGVAR